MKIPFEVDMPFEIPTLRFVLELDHRGHGYNGLQLSAYFDKGREMYGLGLRLKSTDDVGRCAQLLAKAATWTIEVLERWPRNEETGQITGDIAGLATFMGDGGGGYNNGRPVFIANQQGAMACIDSEEHWEKFL